MSRQGNQTHYQANPQCLIYAELLGIVRKTFGIAEQLVWGCVYGSVAKSSLAAPLTRRSTPRQTGKPRMRQATAWWCG